MEIPPDHQALEGRIRELEKEAAQHKRATEVNRALFSISSAVNSIADLLALFRTIHQALSPIIDTTNFYIAHYDQGTDTLTFPYCVDTVDDCYPSVIAVSQTEALTADVIRSGWPLLIRKDEILARRARSALKIPACTPSEIWLGVPLKTRHGTIGVMAVQSYVDSVRYDRTDMAVMVSVASQVALAIERKQADKALRESEKRFHSSQERYRVLFNGMCDAVFVHQCASGGFPGRFIEVNDVACERLGYTRGELLQLTPVDIDAADTIPNIPLMMERLATQGHAIWEGAHITKDGRRISVEINNRVFDFDGVPHILSTARDIGERKLAEEERALNVQRMHVLLQLNQMTEATLQQVTDFALEEAVRLTQSAIGYLAFLNDDESVLTMHSWSRSAMAECAMADKPIVYPVETTGLWGEAVRQRRPVITNDYTATGPLIKGYPEGHVTVRRHMNIPLFVGARIVLVAGVGNKTKAYDQDDVQQLTLLMEGMWRLIERKRAEDALRESEKKYRLIAENTADLISILDMNLRFTYVSPASMRLRGFTVEEAMEQTLDQVLTPESMRLGLAVFEEEMLLEASGTADPDRTRILEVEEYKKDGSLVWMEVSLSFLRDESRKPVEILIVSRDITDRKRVQQALRESESKYRELFEQSPVGIFKTNSKGQVLFANPEMARIIGVNSAQEAIDHIQDLARDLYVDPNRRDTFIDLMRDNGAVENFEYEAKGFNGKRLWLSMNARAREKASDGTFTIDGFTTDITKEKEVQAENKQLETQLQQAQKFEAIGTLAGGIAHDFNNLLMGIQGRASLISMDLETSHPHWEHINAIEECIRSATNLTKQLLGFARGGKYEVKPIDMNELVLGSAAMFGRTKKEIRIHTKCQKSPLVVEADRGQIEQVILNMYINAWQAMPADGGELYLETKTVTLDEANSKPHQVKPGRYVKVSITDTGVGMDEATRLRIFDPFFTTKEKSRGTGLGLASAYGIIKNHGGMITVYSEIGHGTTFNVHLPISDKAMRPEVSKAGGLIKGTATILLVDDEEMIIDVGQAMLQRLGYRVVVANGSQEAVRAITEMGNEIDLVILDLIMPGMDGGKAFDRIREIRPEMPVLLCSGYAINGQAHEIMRRGCNGFIQKPYNISDLSNKVRKVLDDRKN